MANLSSASAQTKVEVTAVGRLLKSRNGEPRVYKVIAVDDEGVVRTVIERPAEAS